MSLRSKFDRGEFAVLVEMEPPKGTDVSRMTASALRAKDKVDAFIVPDMSNAVMRMSALGGAIVLREKGLETAVQVTCRDRNRLALQADLLAASACGVTTVVLTDGGDPSLGDHQGAKAVDDLTLTELLDLVQGLQEGRDLAGFDLTGTPLFLVGASAETTGDCDSLTLEADGMRRQADRGVEFLVAPPVFDTASLDRFASAAEGSGIQIVPTVLLLKSAGMARYLSLHQSDMCIPPSVIERLQNCDDAGAECVHCAAEMVATMKDRGFSGVLISAHGWEDRVPQIVTKSGIRS